MKNHSLLYFSIFVCSLVLGYSISTGFYPSNLDPYPGTVQLVVAESPESIQSLENGQRSILLISASSIDTSDPHLESIWLATYFASDPTIRLLPVFLAGEDQASDFEQQLEVSFNFVPGKDAPVLAQGFTDVLKDNNYWWSGYIVFDQVALTSMVNLIEGTEVSRGTLSEEQKGSAFAKLSDSPQGAYSSQVAAVQSACHKLQEVPAFADLSQLTKLLPNHIYTDLDNSQIQTELQSLFSNDRKPTCRFPTLEISQVVQ